jgi:hypothetical protein
MAKSKKNALTQTAELLQAFQTRLDAISDIAHQAKIAADITTDATDAAVAQNEQTTKSLYALRDYAQRGFDNVTVDMKNVLTVIQGLNERIGKAESEQGAAIRVLQDRVDKLETAVQRLKPVFYAGYNVFITESGQGIRIENKDGSFCENFYVPGVIKSLDAKPFGVMIYLYDGAVYVLCGGPTHSTMFLNLFSSATNATVSSTGVDYRDGDYD